MKEFKIFVASEGGHPLCSQDVLFGMQADIADIEAGRIPLPPYAASANEPIIPLVRNFLGVEVED